MVLKCVKMSVTIYPSTRCNVPKELNFKLVCYAECSSNDDISSVLGQQQDPNGHRSSLQTSTTNQ